MQPGLSSQNYITFNHKGILTGHTVAYNDAYPCDARYIMCYIRR